MERTQGAVADDDSTAHGPPTPGAGGGRQLAGPGPFAADDGSVPADVAEVLGRWQHDRAGLREVVPVLAEHRLLVPLLEVDADLLEGDDADPCAGQDRAVAAVSVRTEEGIVGLAFTGIATLAAWDAAARPMPVPAARVAAAILAEGGVGLVIDADSPSPVRLRGAALLRLAQGAAWPEPWQDQEVQRAVATELAPALVAGELAVRLGDPAGVPSEPGQPRAGLLVELRMDPGLSQELRAARAEVVARRLGASAQLREVFDGTLAVRLA